MVSQNPQKIGESNGMPILPTVQTHKSRKREMCVLWTFSGRPIYPDLALGGEKCTERVVNGLKNPQKIGEANGMPSLPTVPTQVTKTGNVGSVGSVGVFRAAHLYIFGPRGQGNTLRGS